MTIVTLSPNERIACPVRGEVDVEWCSGCPRRVSIDRAGNQTVIVCDQGILPRRYHQARTGAGPLRDVPDIWKSA